MWGWKYLKIVAKYTICNFCLSEDVTSNGAWGNLYFYIAKKERIKSLGQPLRPDQKKRTKAEAFFLDWVRELGKLPPAQRRCWTDYREMNVGGEARRGNVVSSCLVAGTLFLSLAQTLTEPRDGDLARCEQNKPVFFLFAVWIIRCGSVWRRRRRRGAGGRMEPTYRGFAKYSGPTKPPESHVPSFGYASRPPSHSPPTQPFPTSAPLRAPRYLLSEIALLWASFGCYRECRARKKENLSIPIRRK